MSLWDDLKDTTLLEWVLVIFFSVVACIDWPSFFLF